MDDPVWDATSFTKNRDRLLAGEVASRFLAVVLAQPKVKALLSEEHFSVDGTLLDAWAITKSFRPKDGSGPPPDAGRNGEQEFHGQKRRNETRASTTDPDTQLYKKGPGKEAKLCFMGHALMENRNGLIVGAPATRASGHAERLSAQHLIEPPTSYRSRQPSRPRFRGSIFDADLECAPGGGQVERRELTPAAGLPEDGSHDEASIAQRRVQASSR